MSPGLIHFKSSSFKKTNCVFHSVGTLMFFKLLGHIDLEKVIRIPDFPRRDYRIDVGQNHPSNGDDSAFISPSLGNALIFQNIVRIRFIPDSSVGNQHQRRLKIDTNA